MQNVKNLKQISNLDVFETMEAEMKQIMDLFAKERKSRKKELSKLKLELEEKKAKLHNERTHHLKEKNELVMRWQNDSKKH